MTRHLLPCRWRCIRASGAAELPRTEVPLHCIGSCHCCVVGCPVAWMCQREQRELALRGDAPALRAGETSLKTKVKNEIVSPLTVRDCAFCWHIVTRSRGEATTGHLLIPHAASARRPTVVAAHLCCHLSVLLRSFRLRPACDSHTRGRVDWARHTTCRAQLIS